MLDIVTISDPVAAGVLLDPVRSRLVALLAEPGSASSLAERVQLPRQKVNYHLRTLERHGLVELVAERRRGNMTERVLQASGASYVISPSALASVAPDPDRSPDQASARWLLALAARLVRDLGSLITAADRSRRRSATFGMALDIRFASAADRAAFTVELGDAMADLAARYHDEHASGGRRHRMVLAVHPSVRNEQESPR